MFVPAADSCWTWENTHPAPVLSALELLRAVFSLHCPSPCTRMTAHLKTPLSSSWSLQTTPHSSVSFRTVTSLLTDMRLKSWLYGAVLTTWSLTRSKLWRWSWTSGEFFYFDWIPIRLHEEGEVYDLYCSQPTGGDQRARSFTFKDEWDTCIWPSCPPNHPHTLIGFITRSPLHQ